MQLRFFYNFFFFINALFYSCRWLAICEQRNHFKAAVTNIWYLIYIYIFFVAWIDYWHGTRTYSWLNLKMSISFQNPHIGQTPSSLVDLFTKQLSIDWVWLIDDSRLASWLRRCVGEGGGGSSSVAWHGTGTEHIDDIGCWGDVVVHPSRPWASLSSGHRTTRSSRSARQLPLPPPLFFFFHTLACELMFPRTNNRASFPQSCQLECKAHTIYITSLQWAR